ncbi:MAG: ATP-binding protein [Ghiorsea sp.]
MSSLVFIQAGKFESRNLQREFDSIAKSYFVLMSSSWEHKRNITAALATALENELLIENGDGVTDPKFTQLLKILDWGNKEILAAAWIPLVKAEDKEKFESDTSVAKGSSFSIYAGIHDEDQPGIAAEKHFPVTFSRIVESVDMMDGVDLATIPEFSKAFKRSLDGNSVVTVHHAGEYDDNKPIFTVIQPIFRSNKQSNTPLDEHIGFLVIDINLAVMLENTLVAYPAHSLHIHMWDNQPHDDMDNHSNVSGPQLIYTYISRSEELEESAEFVPVTTFAQEKLQLYDREINLRFDASESFFTNHTSNLKWALFGSCLLITLIISMMLANIAKQKMVRLTYKKLSTAVEQSGQAIVITDKDGIIEYVNKAYTVITGYSADDLIGNSPSMIGSGKQEKEFYEEMWQTILAGNIWQGNITERRKGGGFYPALLTISPITIDGEVTSFIGVHDDLSAQKDMEEQLHQSQKLEAIGTLVGGVAHNFNNLLAAIIGKAYLAKREIGRRPEKESEHLTHIESLSHQAADMINQLLVFSRGSHVELGNIPLNTLMKETAKTARVGVPENIQVVMNFTSEPLVVYGSSVELQQVVMNLMNNARDAMSGMEHGCLSVSLELQDENTCLHRANCSVCASHVARLTVEDTGVGISEENLAHIFEPFFTTKAPNKGTGLGLSTLYGTVEGHGGVVNVESELGKGTRFTVCIPVVNDVNTGVVELEDTEIQYAKMPLGVLVMDDDETIRVTLSNILSSLGYAVFTAVDGLDGIEVFKQHRDDIALVISDIVMPNMNGYRATAAIREYASNMPVVYITGYDGSDSERKLQLDDNTKLITKPFDIIKLSHVLYDVIG